VGLEVLTQGGLARVDPAAAPLDPGSVPFANAAGQLTEDAGRFTYGTTTGLDLRRPAGGDVVLRGRITGDTFDRWTVMANGTITTVGGVAAVAVRVPSGSPFVHQLTSTTLGFFGAVPVGQQAVVALTDSSGGTPSDTIAAAGALYSQTDENNFRASIARKVNQIRTALANYGLVV
jgi:hypothetical protein